MDSGASLHVMSKCDLTPEEQGTIQKSTDPSVIMTAHGTIQTAEEATVCVCDLDMFVQGQLLQASAVVLSLGKIVRRNRLFV